MSETRAASGGVADEGSPPDEEGPTDENSVADDGDGTDDAHESRCERLERYLRRRAADGEQYFKSKFIADDLGMSPSEIGALLPEVDETSERLTVEKWGYSSATTWRVVAAEE